MGVIRNSVEVFGLTPEEDIPKKESGQTIEYSEIEYIQIPGNKMRISDLKEVYLKLDISPGRIIELPSGKIIIMDGKKKLSAKYSPKGRYDRPAIVDFELPFNTFIDIPNEAGKIKSIDTYLLDAYFQVIDNRKIYCHTVYMINVNYPILK